MRVVLGVCGGIAAYKAAELLRLLQADALEVEVVMTRAAEEFVRPLTFAALSGNRVITSLWSAESAAGPTGESANDARGESANIDAAIEHIAVAQRAEALIVAPLTADTLAKFAHGFADDFLSTLFLATTAPVVVAPAMNVNMWNHPATQANLGTLRSRGLHIVEPGAGYLACGMVGAGRMAEPAEIAARLREVLARRTDLLGETVLITAAGTREPLDPVRYLGNRSSGKMGFAIAEAAAARGARVMLVAGPSSLPTPNGCERIDVTTSAQMRDAALARLAEATIVFKAAAVSDFRLASVAPQKVKRKGSWTLTLEPTADILAEVAQRRPEGCIVVGFAAETENMLAHAQAKLVAKQVDAIVANDVSGTSSGFDADDNVATFVTHASVLEFPKMSKHALAERLLDATLRLRAGQQAPIMELAGRP